MGSVGRLEGTFPRLSLLNPLPDKSMKTHHTPGPWSHANGIVVGGNKIVADYCASGKYDTASLREQEANARLIAAAPDLLAAMLRLLEYPDNDGALHPGSLDWEDAREAVKKALGN
jgi:hypothetical protein